MTDDQMNDGSQTAANRARRPVIELPDPIVVEILRKMTPQQRLARAFDMWDTAVVMVRGAVRQQHPEFTEEQVLRDVANRLSHGETERARRLMEQEAKSAEPQVRFDGLKKQN